MEGTRTTHPMGTRGRPRGGVLVALITMILALVALVIPAAALAAEGAAAGGEAALVLPDLSSVDFLGMSGQTLLTFGLSVCALGLVFGLVNYLQVKNLPVHRSMREISELIYETCKTYLIQQGKFLALLWVFIAVIMAFYFGVLRDFSVVKVVVILAFSVLGLMFGDPDEGCIEREFDAAPGPKGRQACTGLGALHGLVSGLLGISGGVIACPAQQILLKMPLRDAITNTLLASAVVTGISSGLVISVGVGRGDYTLGEVSSVATLMGIGCSIGAPIGARVGKHLPVLVLHLIDFLLVLGAGLSIMF